MLTVLSPVASYAGPEFHCKARPHQCAASAKHRFLLMLRLGKPLVVYQAAMIWWPYVVWTASPIAMETSRYYF